MQESLSNSEELECTWQRCMRTSMWCMRPTAVRVAPRAPRCGANEACRLLRPMLINTQCGKPAAVRSTPQIARALP
jgi:hypothetical protein